jgi:hypothetical protein
MAETNLLRGGQRTSLPALTLGGGLADGVGVGLHPRRDLPATSEA